jgi:hypothetical protein
MLRNRAISTALTRGGIAAAYGAPAPITVPDLSASTLRGRADPAGRLVGESAGMLNERIDVIQIAGSAVMQLRFDLADAELLAIARIVEAVSGERYRVAALDADGVLELRELIALHDTALERAEDGYAGGTLVLSVRGLGLVIGALAEWIDRRLGDGFIRAYDAIDLPAAEDLLGDLRDLHLRGLHAALATPDHAAV